MKKSYLITAALLLFGQAAALAQNSPPASTTVARPAHATASAQNTVPAEQPSQSPVSPKQQPTARSAEFELSEYGVKFEPDPRLIVVMAALDAAGFDPTPAGRSPSTFRESIRKDQANLDSLLRQRIRDFYERYKIKTPSATLAEQSARYVSLAYALGPPPTFEAPTRTEGLPADVLEVLDFALLVREFYRQSKIEERMPEYMRLHQAESERLNRPTGEMVRATLSYLHTRPQTSIIERVSSGNSNQKGDKKKKGAPNTRPVFVTREKQRRFLIVPDLLAAPGAINFRVIGDDYFAVVPYGIDPASSDLRRAYLQYLIDPLVVRYNRDIAARRIELKSLLDERRTKTNPDLSPDVFLAVARSLVAATDTRMNEVARLEALARRTSERLKAARTETERAAIIKESGEARQEIAVEAVAQLAEGFERGAVLAFYFAEHLRGLETSGFDIANFFSDMMASFNPTREQMRPNEYTPARARFMATRERIKAAGSDSAIENAETLRRATLFQKLAQVDDLLRAKNYPEAEERLRNMLREFQNEPRILFALGQAASLSAQDAFDSNLLNERLNRALEHYGRVIQAASLIDKALISRAHVARGRIFTFLERNAEALREFDAAIKVGDASDKAYKDAVAEKQKLGATPK